MSAQPGDQRTYILDGAGNRFVAVDRRSAVPLQADAARDLARLACANDGGQRIDGLLVLERASGTDDFRMLYLNRDGSHAGFCGNGARCAALLARTLSNGKSALTFESDAGRVSAEFVGDRVIVSMPVHQPHIKLNVQVASSRPVDFVVAGVPHAIVWCEDLGSVDVASEGPALRSHAAFGEPGANVNFARAISDSELHIRTFERGVEAETGACGSGAVATALCQAVRTNARGSLRYFVIPTSGARLAVSFYRDKHGIVDVRLEGPAVLVETRTLRAVA